MSFNPANYDAEFYEYLSRFDPHLETALYATFAHLGKPDRFLDVGCGTGNLVEVCRSSRIYARGIELSEFAQGFIDYDELIYIRDLREPVYLYQGGLIVTFDLVWCVEVAEHLPPESADVLCDTLVRHTHKWLVFTAAHVGQGGQWHLNEQPPEYWIEKLEARGLRYIEDKTEQLRSTWAHVTGPCHWMPENLMVFKREEEPDADILGDDS